MFESDLSNFLELCKKYQRVSNEVMLEFMLISVLQKYSTFWTLILSE